MGRYVYDASRVTQTLEELNDAIDILSNVTTEIQAGLNVIDNAKGSQYIEINASARTSLLGLQAKAEEVIEEDIKTIQSKVTAIEEFENAPWYKKIFASVGMTLSKFAEGIVSGFEDLGDGVASIVGFIGGIFKSEFADSIAEYVAKDHVGDWFAEKYESGALSSLEKYSLYSSESTAANIFKGFGCAVPYVALSMTGVGTGVEIAAAAISGVGSGTEAGIQEALLEDETGALKAGDVFSKAFAQGLWQGTKNAALVYGMNKLSSGIVTNAANKTGKVVAGSADDFAKLTTGSADEVAATAKNMFNSTDDLVATPLKNSAGKLTGYRLNSATSLEAVGDITLDGTNAIVRSFGNSGTTTATHVLAKTGDDLFFNTVKNADDLTGQSFKQLVKNNATVTKTEKIFTKAHKLNDKLPGKVINGTEQGIKNIGTKVSSKVANSTFGQKVAGVADDISSSAFGKNLKKVGTGIKKPIVNKVGNITKTIKNLPVTKVATNFVKNHPGATYALAGTVFTVDQIGEQITGSQYRLDNEAVIQRPNVEMQASTLDYNATISNPSTNNQNNNSGGNTNTGGNSYYNGNSSVGGITDSQGNSNNSSDKLFEENTNNEDNANIENTPNNGEDTNIDNNPIVDENLPNNDENTNNDDNLNVEDNNTSNGNDNLNNENNSTSDTNNEDSSNSEDGTNSGESLTPPTNTENNGSSSSNGNVNSGGGSSWSGDSGYRPSTGGGGYSDTGYESETIVEDTNIPLEEAVTGSLTEIIGGNEYTEIPSSATPITTTTTTAKKNSVIPTIAGLGAAAIAGIGTKAYLDKKENKDSEDFESDEWADEESLDVEYEEDLEDDGDYLNPSDEYAYQEDNMDYPGSYEAVNNNELTSM